MSTKINLRTRGSELLFQRAAPPLSHQSLSYLSSLIRRHRRTIGSAWRRLNPGRPALLVPAHLRKGETLTEAAAGFGVGTATARRYILEAVMLLARRSPSLEQALQAAERAGHTFVVLDGTLIPTDRVAAGRLYHSGKNRMHSMNVQVISASDGTTLWTSGSLPGSVHELRAARVRGIIRRLRAARALRSSPVTGVRRAISPATPARPPFGSG